MPSTELVRNTLPQFPVVFIPAAGTLLNFAARFADLTRAILPALPAGNILFRDRCAGSTLAYQGYDTASIAATIRAVLADRGVSTADPP